MTLGTNSRLQELFQKYIDKTITEEEHAEFFVYIRNPETKDEVLSFMDTHNKNLNTAIGAQEVDWDTMYAKITSSKKVATRKMMSFWKYVAAAIVILVGSYSFYFVSGNNDKTTTALVYHNDVKPGGVKAILTLSDGSRIILDENISGKLAVQDNISIERDERGQIVYHVNDLGINDAQKINTLSTPKGGTFSVVLSDGSKVWLNASSSIEFPVAFSKDARRVEITGEVYFEIEKDAKRPFYVKNRNSEVKVLGTHFNVKAYPDEYRSELTLLEGSIKFTKDGQSQLLKPGKKILYQESSDDTEQVPANIEEVMAWKNDLFVFDDTNIDEIMTELKRWYGVKVKYEGEKPDISFTGVIPRNANISKVLKALERTGDVVFGVKDDVITCEKKLNKQ